MITLFIPGDPVPKGRARMTKTGHAYTPEKTRKYEEKMAFIARGAMDGKPIYEKALMVDMRIYVPIPPSWPDKKKELAIKGEIMPISRPDLDNYVKTLDALNGIVWKDDSQIIALVATKSYGNSGCMRIIIDTVIQI